MKCNLCGSTMLEIVYGLPTPEMIQKSIRDEVVLGGYHKPFGPTHYCLDCQEEHPVHVDNRTPKFYHNN